ncbi:MAG: hypothetical protein F6K53_11300 [Moorea sp. SIO4A1]|uniref:hypothetical protein n=1 Tax=Moorena sp. SIO4A1 TaxID=2607835 RepID=UPI00144E3995|nr:hypothetical protein [Moorena sp. SIO4A1]NEQ57960.1 hypothetical protein [Moorena sp. SIO4A1]
MLEKLLHYHKSLGGALRGGFRGEEVQHQTKPAPNTPYARITSFWVVRYGAASGAKKLNIKPSPPLTHPTQYLPPRFPIPDSRFPTPYSLFPVPCSLNKKNSVKSWLIPMLDRIISCNSQ